MNESQSRRHQILRTSDINHGRGINPGTTVLTLVLDGVDVWDESQWRRLGSILRSNTNLNEISIRMSDPNLGPGEINMLATTLLGCSSNSLKCFILVFNGIGDICLDNFLSALSGNTSLRYLGLCYKNIGLRGFTSLAKLLKNQNLLLTELSIWGASINDECVMVLTDALSKNATLKALDLSGSIDGLTSTGWSSILRLVCKRSSINSTMEANHNLVFVLGDRERAMDALGPINANLLYASLKLNESNEKMLVVRQKIHWNHALGNLNIGDSDIPTSAVPLILAWVGAEPNDMSSNVDQNLDLFSPRVDVDRFRLDSIYRIVKSRANLMASDESKETHPEIDHLFGNKRGAD